MIQISEQVFCDPFLQECFMENAYLPNPYLETPFLIIEDFLSTDHCHDIVSEIQRASCAHKAEVKSMILNSVVTPSVDEEIRRTSIYQLSDILEEIYQKSFLMHQSRIEEYFSMPLTTATPLQVLEYQKGDFYIKHSDDSSEIVDKEGTTVGFTCVAPQRKLTSVLFASSHISHPNAQDQFDGGELIFNYLYNAKGEQITIKPKAGDMVVFPSNPYFSHEVKPVLSGYRLTLVQWHNSIV
ncbi:MAG: 2OG-Fe(II) oxygenase [Campylobacterales bacterium]|nr:2OG-Fe(II) oxygenase [Campylobacterales bacterium]